MQTPRVPKDFWRFLVHVLARAQRVFILRVFSFASMVAHMTLAIQDNDALTQALKAHRGQSIGFVPTMGFLHEGHLSLMRQARKENDIVVVSIFVNPTQFGPNEDLDRYPRDPEGDLAKCKSVGVDFVWMPNTASMYAADHSTTVQVRDLTEHLCGASRPGHFDGVTTIVSKLFHRVRPDRAYFGQKDYQQLAVIRRMVRDLDMPVEIVGLPIVRDADGLALSSRNKYLSPAHRQDALLLSKALERSQTLWQQGERDAQKLIQELRQTIEAGEHTRVDYIELVDADTLRPLTDAPSEHPVAALAVFVGETRLIDNARLDA